MRGSTSCRWIFWPECVEERARSAEEKSGIASGGPLANSTLGLRTSAHSLFHAKTRLFSPIPLPVVATLIAAACGDGRGSLVTLCASGRTRLREIRTFARRRTHFG